MEVQEVRVDPVGLEGPDEQFDDDKMADWEDQEDLEVHHGR